jgi:Protein of unknown function (DUF2721)
MNAPTVFDALHVAVSPVILISAYGLLLLSLTNRLGRAIDRARTLAGEPKSNRDVQIEIIARRAKWIRSAILYAAIAIVSAAVLVLVLFLSVFLPMDMRVLVTVLFTLSLLCLIVCLGYFMVDIFGSLKAMEAELKDADET